MKYMRGAGCLLFWLTVVFCGSVPETALAKVPAGFKAPPINFPRVAEAKQIEGRWAFVYYRAYESVTETIPAPPVFDGVEFMSHNKVRLTSSLNGATVEGTYAVSDGNVTWRYPQPGSDGTAEAVFACYISSPGQSFVLTREKQELVFFNCSRMRDDDLSGAWTSAGQVMTLSPDGAISMEKSGAAGYYRLWTSKTEGPIMTVFLMNPRLGATTVVWKYALEKDRLTFIPVTQSGPRPDFTMTWKKTPSSAP